MRSRPKRSGGTDRPTSANDDPGCRPATNTAKTSNESRSTNCWTSSRTSRNGLRVSLTNWPNRGRTVGIDAVGFDNTEMMLGSTGSIPSRANAKYMSKSMDRCRPHPTQATRTDGGHSEPTQRQRWSCRSRRAPTPPGCRSPEHAGGRSEPNGRAGPPAGGEESAYARSPRDPSDASRTSVMSPPDGRRTNESFICWSRQ
jgi:hypothetical protein